jgi:hypothetical protein
VPRRSGFAYQPALDGALAVAMVLVFHAGLSWMSGGYAATEIADDFLAPLLIDAAVS